MNCVLLILMLALTLPQFALAQIGFNSPAGVTPTQDFEVYSRNGFLVQQKYKYDAADPNASVNNLSCLTPPPALTAFAGILKDPAGDANYTAGVTYSCAQVISVLRNSSGTTVTGIELVFEDLDTEASADYVHIKDAFGREQSYSGSALPTRILVPYNFVTIRFVTNNNASVGRGFRLRWRALLEESASALAPLSFGTSMQFNLARTSFQVGEFNSASGEGSSALGSQNTASGRASSALGGENTASGNYSTALGEGTLPVVTILPRWVVE